MRGNADITLFHKSYNSETRLDEWQHTHFKGVSWHGKQAVSIGNNELHTASSYIVRIYTSSDITASNGNIVVRGLFDCAEPKAAQAEAEGFTVTAVSDNRRGSVYVQHWKLEGK